MAIFYSNLYGLPPSSPPNGTRIYRGPSGPMAVGFVLAIFGTFTNVAGANAFGTNVGGTDVLQLCDVPESAKLVRFAMVPSADLDAANTFTFNLGYTASANAFASASTGLQGATAFTLDEAALMAVAPAPVRGTKLILTRTAGSLAAAGTISFLAEFIHVSP